MSEPDVARVVRQAAYDAKQKMRAMATAGAEEYGIALPGLGLNSEYRSGVESGVKLLLKTIGADMPDIIARAKDIQFTG